MLDLAFLPVLTRAVEAGLAAAALVDRNGNTVCVAGAISDEEAMPLTALVLYRLKSEDLAPRLFAGEIVAIALDDRDVAVGVVKRQLFLVAVLGAPTPGMLELVRELRDGVASMLVDAGADTAEPMPWSGGNGGSGSGPAELPLIEWGVTVRRERGKA